MIAIAAHSLNSVIGKDGGIPWRCPEDLAWFKKNTLGKNIVVGRKTFELLPRLPDRKVWILANRPVSDEKIAKYPDGHVHVVSDIDLLPQDAIVAGGAAVYEALLPHCKELLITVIKKVVEGDAFMPPYEHLFSIRERWRETDTAIFYRFSKKIHG